MIYSISRHNLFMDFSNIKTDKGRPSDIDMYYIGNGYQIFGEIKNEKGTFTNEQKHIYEKFARNSRLNTYVLFLTHNKFVELGDKKVDVAECNVREYYYKGEWHTPRTTTTCQQAFDMIKDKESKNEKQTDTKHYQREQYNDSGIKQIYW